MACAGASARAMPLGCLRVMPFVLLFITLFPASIAHNFDNDNDGSVGVALEPAPPPGYFRVIVQVSNLRSSAVLHNRSSSKHQLSTEPPKSHSHPALLPTVQAVTAHCAFSSSLATRASRALPGCSCASYLGHFHDLCPAQVSGDNVKATSALVQILSKTLATGTGLQASKVTADKILNNSHCFTESPPLSNAGRRLRATSLLPSSEASQQPQPGTHAQQAGLTGRPDPRPNPRGLQEGCLTSALVEMVIDATSQLKEDYRNKVGAWAC